MRNYSALNYNWIDWAREGVPPERGGARRETERPMVAAIRLAEERERQEALNGKQNGSPEGPTNVIEFLPLLGKRSG
jgi:hypothetical protein